MPPRPSGYVPTEENDAKYLSEWTHDEARMASIPSLHQRYLRALKGMKQTDVCQLCFTLLVLNGQSLPVFPDQQ